jgi:hypothetical protein
MITLQTVHSLAFSILVVLPITITWHWMTMPRQHRVRTFFGVRVEPGFRKSLTAEAILNQFRWRIWTCAFGITVTWALIQTVLAESEQPSYVLCLAWIPMATVRLTARINARRFSQDLSPFSAS